LNGLLVPPGDPPALAAALARLIAAPAERQRLGEAAERTLRSAFSFTAGLDLIEARLRAPATVGADQRSCVATSSPL
jgi:glycosyltransferase involved in cell wall biosynthesis